MDGIVFRLRRFCPRNSSKHFGSQKLDHSFRRICCAKDNFCQSGLRGIDSDVAQLIRTAVVLPVLRILVLLTDNWQCVSGWNGRAWLFLVLWLGDRIRPRNHTLPAGSKTVGSELVSRLRCRHELMEQFALKLLPSSRNA
jgi:hypothetical protein